jgi:hypothetical protein
LHLALLAVAACCVDEHFGGGQHDVDCVGRVG